MALVLVGINHTTASVDLREKVAFPPETIDRALTEARGLDSVSETVIVSTCNRTEVYLDCDLQAIRAAQEPDGELPATGTGYQASTLADNRALLDVQAKVIEWMSSFHGLSREELEKVCYSQAEEDVVRHLMRVSCGLDSMVLGEPQILGQIKSAFAVAKDRNHVAGNLGRAFQEAFSIAKEVRTDTAIGQNPVSVAYAGVTLAERIFSHMEELSVLLIGAGRTIELVARHLADKGVSRITVANRTLGNALELAARFGGHGVLLSDIPEQLELADVVVSSTNSQLPLLGKGAVERALKKRRHKPMLLIDLAVPRDIESEVGQIPDAYLYSVDDISEVIEDNVKSRAEAAAQAQSIIERGVEQFQRRRLELNAVDTLKEFRSHADSIRELELGKALKALEKGDNAEKVLNSLARGLTNKLIHSPSVAMKQASAEGRDDLVTATRELFALNSDDSQAE